MMRARVTHRCVPRGDPGLPLLSEHQCGAGPLDADSTQEGVPLTLLAMATQPVHGTWKQSAPSKEHDTHEHVAWVCLSLCPYYCLSLSLCDTGD